MALFSLTIFLISCIYVHYVEPGVRDRISDRTLWKRDAFFNFGGADHSQTIKGDNNLVLASTPNPNNTGKETVIRKAAHDFGRVMESGADLAIAPAQWLHNIQKNWLTYLVCITVLAVCGMNLYCCIRQKISLPAVTQNEIMKLYNMINNHEKKPRMQYTDNIFEI